jgi:Zn-dependent protease with chaperone function
MRTRLFVASIWTLGLLFGMLAAIVLLGLYAAGSISAGLVLGGTVVLNVLAWLFSPKIMDWTLRLFYKATFYNQADFAAAYPQYAGFIDKVAKQNNIPFPKVRVINDDNPTAYSFGSGRWNARLVFTQGITTYLEQDEVEAVLAHELGHVVHRDFIVMSVANAIIQLLYEIYYILGRSKKGNDREGGQLALIGWLAYIFYFIGTYIVLYLNRLREYYADEFSAECLHQGDALSRALIKVAYGIMAKEDNASSTRLLESTKTMGIMSLQSAKSAGLAMKVTNMQPDKVAKVMLFDAVSPWAKLAEISSTHPLTGKRILRLQNIDMAAGKHAVYDIAGAMQTANLDRRRLWKGFFVGGLMYFMVWIVLIASVAAGALINALNVDAAAAGLVAFVVILAVLLSRVFYKYPSANNSQPGDIYSLMTDLYASPVRGRPVQLKGAIVGRGVPGYVFGEDMMMQDDTGLLYLDYQGRFPIFSNLVFALKKIKKLVGQNVSASGWFFRSNTQYLTLKKVETAAGSVKSYPRLWSIIGSVLLAVIFWLVFLLFSAAGTDSLKSGYGQAAGTAASVSAASRDECFSVSVPSGASVTRPVKCSLQISSSGTAANNYTDYLSVDIIAQPSIGSFADQVADWEKQSGIQVVSKQITTVGGLRAEKFVYTYSGTPARQLLIFVDTSSKIKTQYGADAQTFTQIMANYDPPNVSQVDSIVNGLIIKSATL